MSAINKICFLKVIYDHVNSLHGVQDIFFSSKEENSYISLINLSIHVRLVHIIVFFHLLLFTELYHKSIYYFQISFEDCVTFNDFSLVCHLLQHSFRSFKCFQVYPSISISWLCLIWICQMDFIQDQLSSRHTNKRKINHY